jgi:hypothetical protein
MKPALIEREQMDFGMVTTKSPSLPKQHLGQKPKGMWDDGGMFTVRKGFAYAHHGEGKVILGSARCQLTLYQAYANRHKLVEAAEIKWRYEVQRQTMMAAARG